MKPIATPVSARRAIILPFRPCRIFPPRSFTNTARNTAPINPLAEASSEDSMGINLRKMPIVPKISIEPVSIINDRVFLFDFIFIIAESCVISRNES